jgi:uncharacterized membrane protein YesL
VAPLALWTLVVGPLTGGLFGYVRELVAHEHPVWTDLGRHIREAHGASARLALVQAVLTPLLATDAFFFLSQRALGAKVTGLLFLYPLLFWLLALAYQWPLLAEQRQGAWSAVKKSALLVLDNPGRTLLLGLLGALFSVVCAGTLVALPLLWAGTLAFVQTEATRALLRKYGLLAPEPEAEPGPEAGWRVDA